MKKPSIDVIYLPGLGDENDYGRLPRLLKAWKIYGLNVHYHHLGWADKEPFQPKLQRILDKIDSLTSDGGRVALIGTSAGASAALSAFSERSDKVSSVVCICGKIQNPKTVSEDRYAINPAFKDSLYQLPNSLEKLSKKDRSNILSIHPLYDSIVPVPDTMIEGAKAKTIPTVGHTFSIGFALIFGSIGISNFIKEKAPSNKDALYL